MNFQLLFLTPKPLPMNDLIACLVLGFNINLLLTTFAHTNWMLVTASWYFYTTVVFTAMLNYGLLIWQLYHSAEASFWEATCSYFLAENKDNSAPNLPGSFLADMPQGLQEDHRLSSLPGSFPIDNNSPQANDGNGSHYTSLEGINVATQQTVGLGHRSLPHLVDFNLLHQSRSLMNAFTHPSHCDQQFVGSDSGYGSSTDSLAEKPEQDTNSESADHGQSRTEQRGPSAPAGQEAHESLEAPDDNQEVGEGDGSGNGNGTGNGDEDGGDDGQDKNYDADDEEQDSGSGSDSDSDSEDGGEGGDNLGQDEEAEPVQYRYVHTDQHGRRLAWDYTNIPTRFDSSTPPRRSSTALQAWARQFRRAARRQQQQ
ncbi:hypothetical protein PV05_08824 [Exophiala xenobiotica]|uniref:Uncharacterized protein n=1 Tax=Exophiala xenobiotica TaxID=348802 RepID=A0A0D2EEY2_9EURO|nr:uncharacterized protein PV05_08824 [Exophiala xenobiotica]KIW53235.1 hypothetical protein PV05_08824 [Exophiala xenobiotica]